MVNIAKTSARLDKAFEQALQDVARREVLKKTNNIRRRLRTAFRNIIDKHIRINRTIRSIKGAGGNNSLKTHFGLTDDVSIEAVDKIVDIMTDITGPRAIVRTLKDRVEISVDGLNPEDYEGEFDYSEYPFEYESINRNGHSTPIAWLFQLIASPGRLSEEAFPVINNYSIKIFTVVHR